MHEARNPALMLGHRNEHDLCAEKILKAAGWSVVGLLVKTSSIQFLSQLSYQCVEC